MVQFVTVSYSSGTVAASSPDGATWTARTLPATGSWRCVAWNGSVYCAIASNSTEAATSPDGITWTSRSMPSASFWCALAWNGSVFCAIANTSSVAATSPDGITWTARTLPASVGWYDLAWNGSVFCAVAAGSTVAATSPDGITWTERTMPSAAQWSGVAWSGEVFCVVGDSTSAATSPDGITWTVRTLPVSATWNSIAWNGSVFCAIADGSAYAATSPDGITWTARTLPSSVGGESIAWNGDVFCIAASANSNFAATSPDGITWTTRTLPSGGNYYDIAGVNLLDLFTNNSVTTLPLIVASGTGITDTLGSSSASLPIATASGSAYTGNSSDAALPIITASGSGITDTLGSSDQTLPAVSASGTAQIFFDGVVTSGATVTGGIGVNAVYQPEASSAIVTASPSVAVAYTYVTAASSGAFITACASPTIFWGVVTAGVTFAEAVVSTRLMDAVVTGTVTINGVPVGSASYHVSAASEVQIQDGVQFIQDFWDGWAFNLNTGAPSMYEDFKFNSFARIGSNYYGCNDTGIYLLGGELDVAAEIDATVTTGYSDLSTDKFDGGQIKHVTTAYLDARTAAPMTITCRTEGQEYTYTFDTDRTNMASARAMIGKGLKGTLWQFELKNVAGADFEAESLTVLVDPTKRKA